MSRYAPRETFMKNVVKGHDYSRYRRRYRVNPLIAFVLVLLGIGVLLLIVSRWI